MKTRYQKVILALVLLLVVSSAAVSASERQITDQYGRVVMIPNFPSRIVSAAPSNTEILLDLGLRDMIVGVTDWCNYSEVEGVPRVGDINPLNLEAIIALQPDFVLAHQLNGKEIVDALELVGIPVIALQPTDLASLIESVALVGDVTGVKEEAASLVSSMEERQAAIREAGLSVNSNLKVFFILGLYDSIWTAGPGSFIHEAIELTGATNIAEDAPTPWAEYSVEAVIAADPDIVLLGEDPALFYEDPKWSTLAAVRKGQVYQINADRFHLAVPELFSGIEELLQLVQESK